MTGTLDNFVLLEGAGIYSRPAVNRDPMFIWPWTSEPQNLLETRRLCGTRCFIEVLR